MKKLVESQIKRYNKILIAEINNKFISAINFWKEKTFSTDILSFFIFNSLSECSKLLKGSNKMVFFQHLLVNLILISMEVVTKQAELFKKNKFC